MNTNDSNHNWQSPPLVTHSTYQAGHYPAMAMPASPVPPPPVFHPAPPQPRRGLPSWVSVLILAVAVLITLVNGLAAWSTGQQTPASCIEALEHSDALVVHTGELGDLAAEAVEAAAAWDGDALDALTVEVEALHEDWDATYAAYETAAADCRGEGGAL